MIWVTTVGEIQAAHRAGLVLVGAYDNCMPEYLGSQEQWENYIKLLTN
jgi:hypothetical protein